MFIEGQTLRKSFHKFYIQGSNNRFHKLTPLIESHVLVWSTNIA